MLAGYESLQPSRCIDTLVKLSLMCPQICLRLVIISPHVIAMSGHVTDVIIM